ncbi:hypothetical protein BCV70DRAFT_205881 [Testicularia cyperi]|uniref:RING-type domain-containing protein n=1 Tax=Testicularia cyperi TaxID=1882483 RepID=A0A317XQ19_9BASI|nr:hypothetical protein BCV70DRAFT_205881 [Testicularia cyperi]
MARSAALLALSANLVTCCPSLSKSPSVLRESHFILCTLPLIGYTYFIICFAFGLSHLVGGWSADKHYRCSIIRGLSASPRFPRPSCSYCAAFLRTDLAGLPLDALVARCHPPSSHTAGTAQQFLLLFMPADKSGCSDLLSSSVQQSESPCRTAPRHELWPIGLETCSQETHRADTPTNGRAERPCRVREYIVAPVGFGKVLDHKWRRSQSLGKLKRVLNSPRLAAIRHRIEQNRSDDIRNSELVSSSGRRTVPPRFDLISAFQPAPTTGLFPVSAKYEGHRSQPPGASFASRSGFAVVEQAYSIRFSRYQPIITEALCVGDSIRSAFLHTSKQVLPVESDTTRRLAAPLAARPPDERNHSTRQNLVSSTSLPPILACFGVNVVLTDSQTLFFLTLHLVISASSLRPLLHRLAIHSKQAKRELDIGFAKNFLPPAFRDKRQFKHRSPSPMGLFDVGSFRSKKSPGTRDPPASQLNGSNFEDTRLAGRVGPGYDARFAASSRSLSATTHSNRQLNGAKTLQPQRSVSGLSDKNAARQSKLERMMGAGIPEVQVVSSRDRRMPSGLATPPSPGSQIHHIHNHHHSQQHPHQTNSLSRNSTMSRNPAPNEGGDFASSYSRSYSTDLHHSAGAATTFTEMAEVDCPVCLEPLSYRLAGEKPHVVPACGHALHNACFTAIYGPPEAILAAQNPGGRIKGAGSATPGVNAGPPGMCGVCRKPITLKQDDVSSKSHKLAGIPAANGTDDAATIRSGSFQEGPVPQAHEDDPLQLTLGGNAKGRTSSSAASFHSSSSNTYTVPTLRAKPEFHTIYCKPARKDPTKVNVVSVLTIEVPSRRSPIELRDHTLGTISDEFAEDEYDTDRRDEEDSYSDDLKRSGPGYEPNGAHEDVVKSPGVPLVSMPDTQIGFTEQGDRQNVMARAASPDEPGFSFGATPAGLPATDPNRAVLADLQNRVTDWKGHSIEHFGPLVLHDLLDIRQDSVVREFHVYLFEEALLCVTEEKKKGLGRFITPPSSGGVAESGAAPAPLSVSGSKPALKLKGRIYLRHIRRVLDSSAAGEHMLSIIMDDENLDQFVLSFHNVATLSVWKSRLTSLIEGPKASPLMQETSGSETSPRAAVQTARPNQTSPGPFGGPANGFHASGLAGPHPASMMRVHSATASVLSGKSAGSQPTVLSPAQQRFHRRLSNVSSQPSHGSGYSRASMIGAPTAAETVPFYQQWSSSGGLDPRLAPPSMLPHTPLDLVLMISVPAVLPEHISGSISSSAALKLRLIRSTLDFIIHNLGPQDRISLVAFTAGLDGDVKRTGLLNPRRETSRAMLEEFVHNLGRPWDGDDLDPFRVDLSKLGGSGDRVDSVTAVNVGLDVVLGRKAKHGVTGMLLINDMPDGPKRNQMDLVMARAEAANVAIHCFGYGKTHDPSSLWLISNHTRGSYTFVREWYQLRECLAGCIGSLMSVALTDVKIHIGVPEDNHFRIRKIAGLPGAIVSASGKDVDIDVGEIRFGEAKDLLVELELDLSSLLPKLTASRSETKTMGLGGTIEEGSATDDFMQRMGIQDLSLADSDGIDGYMDQLVEEVGVFEADASFKDPATGTSTSRLASPGVLTLEIDTHGTDPLSSGPAGLAAVVADPTVTRRRLEVLVSEMMTRSLLLISRKNHTQALKVMTETRRIIDTVVQALNGPGGHNKRRSVITHRSNQRKQREAASRRTTLSLMAMLSDLDVLCDGLEQQHRPTFERDGRNFGAQQAMILRDQKAWTTRSDTEYLNFKDDNAAAFTAWSASFASSR